MHILHKLLAPEFWSNTTGWSVGVTHEHVQYGYIYIYSAIGQKLLLLRWQLQYLVCSYSLKLCRLVEDSELAVNINTTYKISYNIFLFGGNFFATAKLTYFHRGVWGHALPETF